MLCFAKLTEGYLIALPREEDRQAGRQTRVSVKTRSAELLDVERSQGLDWWSLRHPFLPQFEPCH